MRFHPSRGVIQQFERVAVGRAFGNSLLYHLIVDPTTQL